MTPTEKPTTEKSGSQAPQRRKQRIGRFMLFAGPLLVGLACAYFYLTSGRFISTDNAYIQADKVAISRNLDKFKAVAEAKLDDAKHNLEVSRQQIGIVHDQMSQIIAHLDGDPSVRF